MIKKTTTPSLLSSALSDKLRDICQQGYVKYDTRDYSSAIRLFYSAWTLIPKPQTQWQESGWVLTALGDAYFAKGEFLLGKEALASALHCPKSERNPFIHLRLGQCEFELGETDAACVHFGQVVEHAGIALLDKEDKKYRTLLKH
jgi:tetratricopeptide (TPR) repeat protein